MHVQKFCQITVEYDNFPNKDHLKPNVMPKFIVFPRIWPIF